MEEAGPLLRRLSPEGPLLRRLSQAGLDIPTHLTPTPPTDKANVKRVPDSQRHKGIVHQKLSGLKHSPFISSLPL